MDSARPGSPPPAAAPLRVLLTADLGNSALKLTLWPAPEGPRGEVPPRPLARFCELSPGPLASQVEAWLASVQAPAQTGGLGPIRIEAQALCAVGAREREDTVRAFLSGLAPEGLGGPVDSGVENRCREPHSVGADRLFAARGAAEWVGGSAIVVDAGTALTVDAVRWEGPGGAPPAFLGGAIAPGPGLLARALAEGAARLPRIEPRPAPPALGRETREAISAGVGVGLWGAAAELARRVGLEAGLAGAPRVLTGGARGFLLEPVPFWPGDLREVPDLVAFGLWVALADARAGTAG